MRKSVSCPLTNQAGWDIVVCSERTESKPKQENEDVVHGERD